MAAAPPPPPRSPSAATRGPGGEPASPRRPPHHRRPRTGARTGAGRANAPPLLLRPSPATVCRLGAGRGGAGGDLRPAEGAAALRLGPASVLPSNRHGPAEAEVSRPGGAGTGAGGPQQAGLRRGPPATSVPVPGVPRGPSRARPRRHAQSPQQPRAPQRPPRVRVPAEPARPRRPGQPVPPPRVGRLRAPAAARGGLHAAEPVLRGHRPQLAARRRPLGLQAPGSVRRGGLGVGQRPPAAEGGRGVGARHPLAAGHLLRALPERQLGRQGGAAQPVLRTGAGSRAGGSGERDRQTAAANTQQDGHVRHRLSGQVFLPIGTCHQSCPGLPLCSAPPGARRPTAGPCGALGSHRWHFQGHAGQAQCDGCAVRFVPGLRAVQRGGVLLALPTECTCPLCTLEPLMAAPLPREEAHTLFSKHTWRGGAATHICPANT